jgi:hypothetical protein
MDAHPSIGIFAPREDGLVAGLPDELGSVQERMSLQEVHKGFSGAEAYVPMVKGVF